VRRRWHGGGRALRGSDLRDAPDLVIRGGTIVDGSGAPPFAADVVVRGDRIAGIGRYDGPAAEVIDARGLFVTPGFVDVHTHLDAQLTWDPAAAISTAHGVTTVVVGNCGVGFAPCRERDRDYLTFLMEGVEDIPRAAIAAGMRWGWETFPEYLAALGAVGLGPNVGAYVAHAPLRVFTMGERGATDAVPTAEERTAMRSAVADALTAGALGVSTGRTTMHRTPAGDAVPGTFADREELLALAEPLGRIGAGVFQVIPYGAAGEAADGYARDHDLLVEIARQSGRPVSVGLTQVRQYPEVWRSALDAIAAAAATGARLVPQVAPRSIGLVLGFGGLLSPLLLFPAAGDLVGRPEPEVLAALRDPAVRTRLAASLDPAGEIMAGLTTLDRVFPLEDRGVLAYETDRARSVVGLAEAVGTTPGAILLERLVASELRALFLVALYNPDLEAAGAMLAHPLTVPGLGDAGAHTSQTCDVGVSTFVLAYWVRHRQALSLPAAVRKLSFETATTWGIPQRGLVRPGWYADLNVIDLARLDLALPEVRHDLPGGAPNLVQGARGYVATVVNGRVVMRDGASTGALPGRVLRNEAVAPAG
jgi:N-acyl-D-aspartate/D-glutamate deacylase